MQKNNHIEKNHIVMMQKKNHIDNGMIMSRGI